MELWRNWNKPAEEKRRELLNAYLDDELAPDERRRVEQDLRQDARLRAELEQLRFLKQQLSRMPRRRAPRNFTLDTAAYARPAPRPAMQAYPVLRGATAFVAFIFAIVLAANVFTGQLLPGAFAPAAQVAESVTMEEAAPAAVLESPALEATQAVTSELAQGVAPEEGADAALQAIPESGIEATSEAGVAAGGAAGEETEAARTAEESEQAPATELAAEESLPFSTGITATEELAAGQAMEAVPPTASEIAAEATAAAESPEATGVAPASLLPQLALWLGLLLLILIIMLLLVRRRARPF